AFIFGAVVPKENRFAQILADKLEDLVVVLLLPLFFAYSGLRTEIGLLNTGAGWMMCALVITTACIGKFGGSAVAARLTGLRGRGGGDTGGLHGADVRRVRSLRPGDGDRRRRARGGHRQRRPAVRAPPGAADRSRLVRPPPASRSRRRDGARAAARACRAART